ncbi:MAG: hypothetical protein R3E97_14260 [Candidatus Eisenbacteria bacterium]
MKKLLGFLSGVMCLGLAANVASAGPNAGGTLIVHGDPSVVYTVDIDNYCGFAPLAGGCESALTNYPADETFVWWVKAAFPEGAAPRLAGVVFGVNYDEAAITVLGFGPCGDFELADGSWPAPGSGTAITFQNAQTSQLVDLYWFAGYNYSYYGADVSFDLIANPSQGAKFADDSVPSILDDIAGLGMLGFGNNPGSLPCPAAGAREGACCFEDGSCQILTADDCGLAAGTYQGDDTVCDPNPCPQPPATGACCFEDGSCQVLTADDCGLAGGSYFGDDTVCDPNPCPQPPVFGACCFEDGSCAVTTEADCQGTYQGDDTVCDPNPCPAPPTTGACCSDAGSCSIQTEEDCLNAGSEYLGDGEPCSPDPCLKPGACCFDEVCEFMSPYDCEDMNGAFQGEETSCDPNPCVPASGACCFPEGICEFLNEVDCDAAMGDYQGDGSVCDPNPCPQPPVGACCFEDGSCMVVKQADCQGTYQGDDSVCDPNPCPQPPATGACCFEDGSCQVLTADECDAAGGVYQADDMPCDPNPCPVVPVQERSWGEIKNTYRR